MTSSTTLRLPDGLKARADAYSAELGVSLNALCAVALRDYLDARQVAAGAQPPPGKPQAPPAAVQPAATVAAERVEQEMARARERSVLPDAVPKVGANQPCPCGSGKKYKRCHGGKA